MSKNKTFVWPKGRRGAVSLTFDDARISQVDNGLPILDKHGIKATFYVSLENFDARLPQWRQALANGQEIGNHTTSHSCSGNFCFARQNPLEEFTLDRMEADILQASRDIEERIGQVPTSFAYPCGQTFVGRGLNRASYVPVVAKHFKSGRGYRAESQNDPFFCDEAVLCGTEADGQSIETLTAWVDQAVQDGSWLILAGHEIDDGGHQTVSRSVLDAFCQLMLARVDDVWCDTVSNIAEYVIANRA